MAISPADRCPGAHVAVDANGREVTSDARTTGLGEQLSGTCLVLPWMMMLSTSRRTTALRKADRSARWSR